MPSLEREIAAGLVADPVRCVPIAWGLLRFDDFSETLDGRELAWLYEGFVEAWEGTAGAYQPGPTYETALAASYGDWWHVSEGPAIAWLEEMLALGAYAATLHVYEALCEQLAARRQMQRSAYMLWETYQLFRMMVGGTADVGSQARAAEVIDAACERLQEIKARLPAGSKQPGLNETNVAVGRW